VRCTTSLYIIRCTRERPASSRRGNKRAGYGFTTSKPILDEAVGIHGKLTTGRNPTLSVLIEMDF
jgi:hypothetical protein